MTLHQVILIYKCLFFSHKDSLFKPLVHVLQLYITPSKKVKQLLIKISNRNLYQPKVKVKTADKPVGPWYMYKTIKKIGIK